MYGYTSAFNGYIALLIVVITVALCYYACRNQKKTTQLLMIFMTVSYFLYSGIGIAYEEIRNDYILPYSIFLFCLFIPFRKNKNVDGKYDFSIFDEYLIDRKITIKKLAIVYLILLLLPCLFPTFKLNNIARFFSPGNIVDIFDTYAETRGSIIYSLSRTVALLFSPFFYVYIGILVTDKKRILAVCLIILQMLLNFCPSCYLGRGKLVAYALVILFIFSPPINDGKFVKRTFVLLLGLAIASIPVLYAFVFFRAGSVAETMSFGEIAESLFMSESFYPVFYDQILSQKVDAGLLFTMILWVICLPIPSFIWSSKPVIDKWAFTYMVTGLQVGDRGFSILLPSALGEGFQFGGRYLFWVYALIVGIVYSLFFKFYNKHKTLFYLSLVVIIDSLELGRSGAGAIVPGLINGSISLLVVYLFFKRGKYIL